MPANQHPLPKGPLRALPTDGCPVYAIDSHLRTVAGAGDHTVTERTALAEDMYRYRYGGAVELRTRLTEAFRWAIVEIARRHGSIDSMVVAPPPSDQTVYRRMIDFSAALSASAGIPSAQHWVACIAQPGDAPTRHRTFRLSSDRALTSITGTSILVIDDIWRSGRTLMDLCGLLKRTGGAREVIGLVGTVVEKRGRP